MNITEKERATLLAILSSDFGDAGENPTWLFDVSDSFVDAGFSRSSFPGVVASLNKKGITGSQENTGDDDIIWLTDEGKKIAASLPR